MSSAAAIGPSRARRHRLAPALSFSVLGLLSYLALGSVLGRWESTSSARLSQLVYLGPQLGDLRWAAAALQVDAGAGFRLLGGLLGWGGNVEAALRSILRTRAGLALGCTRVWSAALGELSVTRLSVNGLVRRLVDTPVQLSDVALAASCLGAGALLSARLDLHLSGAMPGVVLDLLFGRTIGTPGLTAFLQ
jgi:hypothetical protein